MQNIEIAVDLEIIALKLVAPQAVVDLFFRYFPGAISRGNNIPSEKSYYTMICNQMENKHMVPSESAKKIKNFSGVPYWFWKSKNKTFALSTKEYDDSLHMIVRKDRNIVVYFPMKIQLADVEAIWMVRIFRELYLYEAIRQGMLPFHASGIVYENCSTVFMGEKNAGKTTSLFSCVQGFGAQPLSNDLVLLGERDNELWSFGWPLSITIGNKLLMKTDKKALIYPQVEKTRFFPDQFTQIFQTEWKWSAKLKNIVFPCVQLKTSTFSIENEEYKNAIDTISDSLLSFSQENIVGLETEPISLTKLLVLFQKKITFLSMEGDIWKNSFQLKQALEINQLKGKVE